MSAIEIKNITKKFNNFIAVDNVSFNIEQGEIFGFLGPNGAGKTTTISMLATILKPTSGSAFINDNSIITQKEAVRKSIGIVFQDPTLDEELTGRENLDFHGRLYGMRREFRDERIDEVLELVELSDKADNLVKTYSGGMKRRLEIARGLMHIPRILFLDEPTIGLDPQTRMKLWEYIRKISKEQKLTIILTTHYLEEADSLCDRIAIIDHGKIVANGTPDALKSKLGGDIITLGSNQLEKLETLLAKFEITDIKRLDDALSVTIKDGEKLLPKIIEFVHRNGVTVDSISLKRPSLEEVFVHHTGRSIREEEGDGKANARLMSRMRMR